VAVVRGFLARRSISKYYKSRYTKVLDESSGYYYFFDNWDSQAETFWHKPRLAFPHDIQVHNGYDKDDYMQGDKYSYQDVQFGPFVKLNGLGKKSVRRSKHVVFKPINEWRNIAISKNEDFDWENADFGSVISWLEGLKPIELYVDEPALIRFAICYNNWARVLKCMRDHPDNLIIQIHGWFAFSKSEIDNDAGYLSEAAVDVMNWAREMCFQDYKEVSPTIRLMSLHCLHNLLSQRIGRAEYFSLQNVKEQGPQRTKAIESHIQGRITAITMYLKFIPMELVPESQKGSKEFKIVKQPTRRALDIVEVAIACLACLGHEPEHKEKLIYNATESVMNAMVICIDSGALVYNALMYFYNVMYRSESGWEHVIECGMKDKMELIRYHHAGDPELMKQFQRVHLALKKDGWRGGIENKIEMEMNGFVADEHTKTLAQKLVRDPDKKMELHFDSQDSIQNNRIIDSDKKGSESKGEGGAKVDSKAENSGGGRAPEEDDDVDDVADSKSVRDDSSIISELSK
jgi:hypothetical protein